MSTRRALEAVSRAVAVADLDAWRGGLPRGPLRWLVARRVRSALVKAGRLLSMPVEAPAAGPTRARTDGERDPIGAKVALLQAAWLVLAGRAAGLSARVSREELASLYWREHDLRARRHELSGGVRLAIALGVAAVVAGALVLALTRPWVTPPPPPPSTLAHLEEQREAAWVEALTDWVVALDQLNRKRADGALSGPIAEAEDALAAHRRAVLDPALAHDLSAEALAALEQVLDAATSASRGGEGWEQREQAFAERVRELNRALRQSGSGYFFDAYAALYPDARAEAALFVFRVASRTAFQSGDEVIEALHLRRVDRLNLVQFLLGYTSKRMDVAVLLLDKLEEEIATRLGPALEPGAEMPMHLPEEDEGQTWWLEVRKRAGQCVREAFYAAIPGQQQALSEIGELLHRRVSLVDDWNQRLESRGVTLRELATLEVASSLRDRLEALTSPEARKVLDEIQSRLETDEMRPLFTRLLARHARPVEQHEVQHRLDYAAGEDFAPPPALLEALGVAPDSDEARSDEVMRVAYELSAYTAELARDPEWVKVNLALLAEHLYDGSGGAEGWSALLILDGLAERLGLFSRPAAPLARLSEQRPVAPERVAAVHLALMDEPLPALAKAAGELWQGWFLAPLAPLARLDALP